MTVGEEESGWQKHDLQGGYERWLLQCPPEGSAGVWDGSNPRQVSSQKCWAAGDFERVIENEWRALSRSVACKEEEEEEEVKEGYAESRKAVGGSRVSSGDERMTVS